MKKEKPENTGKVSPEEISELEETIKQFEENEEEKEEPETQKEFKINPDFVEDLNLIDFSSQGPLQTESIFQRVQDSEESLEQNLQFAPVTKIRKEKYDESKYDNKYFEDKYSEETPNYTGTTETEKKETSNLGENQDNQNNQFR